MEFGSTILIYVNLLVYTLFAILSFAETVTHFISPGAYATGYTVVSILMYIGWIIIAIFVPVNTGKYKTIRDAIRSTNSTLFLTTLRAFYVVALLVFLINEALLWDWVGEFGFSTHLNYSDPANLNLTQWILTHAFIGISNTFLLMTGLYAASFYIILVFPKLTGVNEEYMRQQEIMLDEQ